MVPALAYVAGLDAQRRDLEARVEDGKKQFAGVELPQRTLGIVGLGAIGSLVADTAIKLGMKVIGFDPEITVDAAWRLPSSVRRAHSIEELLKQSDFVTLHVPLLAATRHLIDAERLAVMKPGAVLLNFARDALVDEEARRRARCARAGSSTTCAISRAPRCCASPASSRCRTSARRPRRPRRTARSWSSTRCASTWRTARSPTPSTFPTSRCRASRRTASRSPTPTCPNMLGQISTTMAQAGLNIHNMVNKSRGEMAYTLVDVDSPMQDAVIAAIAAIDGVLSVRAIPAEAPD